MNDTDYKGFAYDAAWLVALALNRTARDLGPNNYLDTLPFGDKNFSDFMKDNLLTTEFQGMTVGVIGYLGYAVSFKTVYMIFYLTISVYFLY